MIGFISGIIIGAILGWIASINHARKQVKIIREPCPCVGNPIIRALHEDPYNPKTDPVIKKFDERIRRIRRGLE